ncbi:uncharacterized protein [Amphiura filiformis]|uniref:uncharacterized protein n=1 Tax=Amphiura filiformis TaxID=82378 RepID=UPI003B20E5F0
MAGLTIDGSELGNNQYLTVQLLMVHSEKLFNYLYRGQCEQDSQIGRRGKQQTSIPTLITERKANHHPNRGVNLSNLKQLPNLYTPPPICLNACLWNVQSAANKTTQIADYIQEHDIDVFIMTETWLHDYDAVIIGELTPPGYTYLNVPRPSGTRGGGIGVVFKTPLKLRQIPQEIHTTYFEHVYITDFTKRLTLVVIYRPPPSRDNGFRTSDFLTEFDSFVDDISVSPRKLLLVGDFNIHWDEQNKWDVKKYASIISSVNFQQHVDKPTHRSGHILDHVLSCPDDELIRKIRDDLHAGVCDPANDVPCDNCPQFAQFHPLTEDEVLHVISKSSNASCLLDPEPTWLLKDHIQYHLPALTAIVNASLTSGVFPKAAHSAVVSPLIKKPSLDKDNLQNYRPVSNLSHLAKVIEKCASAQLVEHFNTNELTDPLQ